MPTRIKFFIAPFALAAGLALATPAMAETYRPREMPAQFDRMDQRINEIGESRRFTNAEYRQLKNRVDALRISYRQYGRNGFSRREIHGLNERIENVQQLIREQARDGQNQPPRRDQPRDGDNQPPRRDQPRDGDNQPPRPDQPRDSGYQPPRR